MQGNEWGGRGNVVTMDILASQHVDFFKEVCYYVPLSREGGHLTFQNTGLCHSNGKVTPINPRKFLNSIPINPEKFPKIIPINPEMPKQLINE